MPASSLASRTSSGRLYTTTIANMAQSTTLNFTLLCLLFLTAAAGSNEAVSCLPVSLTQSLFLSPVFTSCLCTSVSCFVLYIISSFPTFDYPLLVSSSFFTVGQSFTFSLSLYLIRWSELNERQSLKSTKRAQGDRPALLCACPTPGCSQWALSEAGPASGSRREVLRRGRL